jgi:nicotinamidase-related amidase
VPRITAAQPYAYAFPRAGVALVMIDMQRDFLEPGGFGAALGNDVARLAPAIAPAARLIAAFRRLGLLVIHTREAHRPDLSDCPPAKRMRGGAQLRIGDAGPMGRILVAGEPGVEIIPALAPVPGEIVIDKPGKGAFYATDLQTILMNRRIESMVVCGVTTEVCVHSTVREANDRGYRCIVPADCCGSYFPEFHAAGLRMISAQGGIFGWVSDARRILEAFG